MAFFLINIFFLTFEIIPFIPLQDAVPNSSTGGESGFLKSMFKYFLDLPLHKTKLIKVSVPSLLHHNTFCSSSYSYYDTNYRSCGDLGSHSDRHFSFFSRFSSLDFYLNSILNVGNEGN